MQTILFTLSYICLILIDASGDAFKYLDKYSPRTVVIPKWKKWFGWFSEDLIILYAILLYPYLIMYYEVTALQIFVYFIGYVLMRVALFNIIWNAWVPNVAWWFWGKTKWWDRILNWITYTSWFAKKFRPTPQAIFVRISIISFLFSLVCTGVWLLFPQ